MYSRNIDAFINAYIEKKGLKKADILPSKPLSPTVFQETTAKITPRLAVRCGLELNQVPSRLAEFAEEGHNQLCPSNMARISVGMATCGQAAGADYRYELLRKRHDFENKVIVRQVGCLGACFEEPLITVRTPNGFHYIFSQADSNTHWPIIYIARGDNVHRGFKLVLREKEPGILTGFGDLTPEAVSDNNLNAFFQFQSRRVTENCGLIDPFSLPEYAATGGYFALAKALFKLSPKQIIDTVAASGLRGRGGGGFSTGRKWETAAARENHRRVLIANADEGDPSAYMDRTLMESDPHRILEGILLAAYATGAEQAYIFVRKEYSLSVETLRQAIRDAEAAGFLGNNILGSNFSLAIELVTSAGAFVCGEETAMIEAMEGRRGEPRLRPPYPAQMGFLGRPTVINNVETLANIPWIITHGAEAFREMGNTDSPGTKIFCLAGDIPRMGCIEVPLGTSSKTVVESIGGAASENVKAIQIGGPSGGIVPFTDFAIDFSTVTAIGAMIGSGGLIVLNQRRCLVDISHHFINFMADESCGRCLLCRDGLATLADMLQKLTTNQEVMPNQPETQNILAKIEELCVIVANLSACGLGRSSVHPLTTSLRYFRKEFESHLGGICPATSCKSLIRFEIEYSKCKDCLACYECCPVQAVKLDQLKKGVERYYFDHVRCLRCRTCEQICPRCCIKAVSDGKVV